MFNGKDLSKEPPRSPRVRMGGYSILARTIDKGRAVLNGTVGEYEYNCGLDQMLFGFKGLDHEEVKRFLASGASDEEVLDWVNSHGTPKTSAEIEEFSNSFEKFRPYDDPDLRELFRKTYGSLGLDPKTSTVADYLDTDDRVSFPILIDDSLPCASDGKLPSKVVDWIRRKLSSSAASQP